MSDAKINMMLAKITQEMRLMENRLADRIDTRISQFEQYNLTGISAISRRSSFSAEIMEKIPE